MRRIPLLALAVVCLGLAARPARAADVVAVTLDPAKVLNRVDEKVYGHFLEHIYHSVNGGLWGEMVWNRSFEDAGSMGNWRLEDGQVLQKSQAADVRLTFGDAKWRDYEFTLEAQKTGGAEGFLVLFRVKNQREFYWFNLGGWQNKNHGLERGLNDGNRWRTIGKMTPGSIDAGKWYKIRVRCEGPHLQLWLDDRQLLDFKDDEKGHLAGKVGIGTWSTQARFRNLKVTSLDGKVLFQGLPEVQAQTGVAPNWQLYGSGKASLVSDGALNGDNCQLIEADSVETGVAQTPLCVRKDDALSGLLWARGSAPDGLVVRLLDGDKKLAEQTLPAPGEQWKELPLQLKIPATAENATLQVGVRGKGKVWFDQVSLMAASSWQTGGFRPDLLKAVAELRPPIIRWPGGCYAEHYRWQHGVGPQHKRIAFPLRMWDDRDVNSYGTDEFIAMCRKVGSEPLLVINIGRHDKPEKRAEYITEACAWIEYCNGPATSKWGSLRAANGHPEPYNVKYWEIDNETWGMGAENYAAAVRDFAPAMRKADSSIKLLACGSGGLGEGRNGQAWNRIVIEGCAKHIDYLSVHHYENPNNYRTGPDKSEAFMRETARLIAASQNPKMKVYCSEWNAQSTDWRTGLYAGGVLCAFERCGDFFEIGGPALFLRHVSATGWDNAFVNFDHRTWFPAPNYVVMKLWRDCYAPHRIAATGETGPLNAVATKSADGRTLYYKAVNTTEQAVPLKLTVAAGFAIVKASLQVVAPGKLDARNMLDAPDAVRVESGRAKVAGQTVEVELPPLSAGVVVIDVQVK